MRVVVLVVLLLAGLEAHGFYFKSKSYGNNNVDYHGNTAQQTRYSNGHHGNSNYGSGNRGNGQQQLMNGAAAGSTGRKKQYGIYGTPGKQETYKTWAKEWDSQGVARHVEVPEHMENTLHGYMDQITSFLGSLLWPFGQLSGQGNSNASTGKGQEGNATEATTPEPTAPPTTTPTPTPTTTTTTESVYYPDYQSRVPVVWDHITNTAASRKEIQSDAVAAILALADLADLRCVDEDGPTELDVIFLCKDNAKERFSGVDAVLRRRDPLVEGIGNN